MTDRTTVAELGRRRAEAMKQVEAVTEELRVAVVEADRAGHTVAQIALWAGVPRMTVARWLKAEGDDPT